MMDGLALRCGFCDHHHAHYQMLRDYRQSFLQQLLILLHGQEDRRKLHSRQTPVVCVAARPDTRGR
jgi:hypothetical protein